MADPNADVDGMTLDQLQAEFVVLGDRLSKVEMRRARIDKRMRAMRASAMAKASVAGMSEQEKAALRAELEVGK
jgi:hypothetical protein